MRDGADPNLGLYHEMDGSMGGTSTAALVAAFKGNADVLHFLVDKGGADPNLASSSGLWTPCSLACHEHNHDCVRVLITFGAEPDHCTKLFDSHFEGMETCTCPVDIPGSRMLLMKVYGSDLEFVSTRGGGKN